jgi:hypothetical protein
MRSRGLLVASLVLLAAGGSVAPARAVDGDGAPPTLVTPDRASWLVGSQLDLDLDYCPGLNLTVARQTFSWTATDDSGSVASSVVVVPWAAEPYELSLAPSATSAIVRTDDWQTDCGGPRGFPDTYEVTATDPAGNATTNVVMGGAFSTIQQDGTVDSPYGARVSVHYVGDWRSVALPTASHGTLARSDDPDAAVELTVTALADRFNPPAATGTNLALVMREGPRAARFAIFQNGALVARVTPYAAHSHARTIVWQGPAALGDTLRVVRLAGRDPDAPRGGPLTLTLDAILAN